MSIVPEQMLSDLQEAASKRAYEAVSIQAQFLDGDQRSAFYGMLGVEMFAYAAAAAKHARGENIDKPDRALAAALMRQFADTLERGAS